MGLSISVVCLLPRGFVVGLALGLHTSGQWIHPSGSSHSFKFNAIYGAAMQCIAFVFEDGQDTCAGFV